MAMAQLSVGALWNWSHAAAKSKLWEQSAGNMQKARREPTEGDAACSECNVELCNAESTSGENAGTGAAPAVEHVLEMLGGDEVRIWCTAAGGACNEVATKFDGVALQGVASFSCAPASSCEASGGSAQHPDAVAFNAAVWTTLGDPAEAFAELGA